MKTTKNKIVYEKDFKFEGKVNSIVFPDSLEEIKNVIKLSNLDIVPRGSGMSFVGGVTPHESVIIDMGKRNKVVEFNSNRKTITVEAGMVFSDINLELEKHGLEVPVNPFLGDIRTIGGLVATNASGDREIKYGKIKNWIDSLEVINGNGEIQELGKSDISDFTGLEGTTGIITKVKLRLTTKKPRTMNVYKSDSIDEVLEMTKKLKLDHEISIIHLFDKMTSLLSGLENMYHVFIEYESNKGEMKNKIYEKFTKIKNKSYYTLAKNGFTVIENPKFFSDSLREFLFYLEESRVPYFSDIASGVVFVCIKPEMKKTLEEVNYKIKRLRGRTSYNFGIGIDKTEFLDLNEKKLIERVQLRNDPQGKFNKNKLINSEIKLNPNFDGKVLSEREKQFETPEDIQEIKPTSKTVGEVMAEMEEERIEKTLFQEDKEGQSIDDDAGLFEELKTPEEKLEEFMIKEEIEDEIHDILEKPPINLEEDISEVKPRPEKKDEPPQVKTEINEKRQNIIDAVEQGKTATKPRMTKEEEEEVKKIAGGWFK